MEDKKKYMEMLASLAADHPELEEQVNNLHEALFDLSAPDIGGEEEQDMSEELPMDEEESMEDEGEVEIAVALPGKKMIPKELMDEEAPMPKKHEAMMAKKKPKY